MFKNDLLDKYPSQVNNRHLNITKDVNQVLFIANFEEAFAHLVIN